MTEYKALSPHFKYQFVDPNQKPEVAQEFGAKHMGDVIVAYGIRKVPFGCRRARRPSREEDVTGAILKLTSDKAKKVCFVTGHGEKSLTDGCAGWLHPGGAGLKKETYTTETINLSRRTAYPPTAASW